MRILFVSAEVAPFSKTGGLGDVADALPAALQSVGHELMVVSPYYRRVADGDHTIHRVYQGLRLAALGGFPVDVHLAQDGRNWFIDSPHFFDREGLYRNDGDEHRRFLLLTHASLELCRKRQWAADIVHANDWHTGLLPLYLKSLYRDELSLSGARSVFTIHNLGYQGGFPADIVADLVLGEQQYLLHQDHFRQGRISFMEHALMYADAVTTVSPTYAAEIQTPEYGAGLDHLLRRRSRDLVGILNGIDATTWNPRSDPRIPAHYSETELEAKGGNRRALLEGAEIDPGSEKLTVGVISRLTSQKGIELMMRPLARQLEAGRINLVALGSGETKYEQAFGWLAQTFPGAASYRQGYDEDLAHLIEAGADVFLMPSRYEPSGLNQMYSLAYGTPPIVRRTGGLADSVSHYDPERGEGTGFVFEHYTESGLAWALDQALWLFPQKDQWERLQRNGMAVDNSWEQRASQYDGLYRRVRGEQTE